MRSKASIAPGNRGRRDRARAGFTLAEVIAALLFMAIVIPVAVQGLRVASLVGETAERKIQAGRLAERLLNECLVTTNWGKAMQQGTISEGDRQFTWVMRTEMWTGDPGAYAPRLLSVEVTYPVQDRQCLVRLSTLVGNSSP